MSRIFLLDKSGSMEMRLEDTIGGFNAFVRDQVTSGGTMSLYTFSDTCTCEYKDIPIEDVKQLTHETYVPQGSTALFDSMGHILKNHKDGFFVILTDGHENSSKTYTKAHIKDLIALSKLEILYIGADIEEANEIGITNTLFYNGEHTRDALRTASQSVTLSFEKQI